MLTPNFDKGKGFSTKAEIRYLFNYLVCKLSRSVVSDSLRTTAL